MKDPVLCNEHTFLSNLSVVQRYCLSRKYLTRNAKKPLIRGGCQFANKFHRNTANQWCHHVVARLVKPQTVARPRSRRQAFAKPMAATNDAKLQAVPDRHSGRHAFAKPMAAANDANLQAVPNRPSVQENSAHGMVVENDAKHQDVPIRQWLLVHSSFAEHMEAANDAKHQGVPSQQYLVQSLVA